eukprot:9130-Heterococcus_DN1.PRE.3
MDFDTLASPTTQLQHVATTTAATNNAVNAASWENDLSSILLAPVQNHVNNNNSNAAIDVQQGATQSKHRSTSDRKRSSKKKNSSSRDKHSSPSADTRALNNDDYLLL